MSNAAATAGARSFDGGARTSGRPMTSGNQAGSRNAMATAIVLVTVAIGLWAIISYMNAMAATLASVEATNQKIVTQMTEANTGLAHLDTKTQRVASMNTTAAALQKEMAAIDSSMGSMLTGVAQIGDNMAGLGSSLQQLDREVSTVAKTNESIAGRLGGINKGLAKQRTQVRGLKRDVVATSAGLKQVPPILEITNARLGHVNKTVCYMGGVGVQNQISIKVDFLGIPNGSANIFATMIPGGAWRC